MGSSQDHHFAHLLETFNVESEQLGDKRYKFFNVAKLDNAKFSRLPFSIRVLLEAAVRKCDGFQIKPLDVESILNWESTQSLADVVDVPFQPGRVILQDFTGVPAVVDFAAMRDAVQDLGGDPDEINPQCPSDLVIDHSVQVDFARSGDALAKNEKLEFERNKERFTFLKWGANAFNNLLIIPPGSGIVHQVNLEYLARVCFVEPTDKRDEYLCYPDSVVGTDSHTTMINGLGVLGWGVGGIEAEAVMLGQPISMVLPKIVGYKITGELNPLITSTDVVLTITKHLRTKGVVGKFVEFFGPGVAKLSIADRATIANMCPEYGATCAFFPLDDESINYLTQTNRNEEMIRIVKSYLTASGLKRDYADQEQDPIFSEVVQLDLGSVVASCSGPKRPQDRVAVTELQQEFRQSLPSPVSFKGFGVSSQHLDKTVAFIHQGHEYVLRHGSVLIAAITSCTNTSNPSVMLGAGLLARNAVQSGLSVLPYIKTSLSPGSGVVTYYLKESGVIPYLETLGFNIAGYGCMTCIGNSGPLEATVSEAVKQGDLVCCGVLSGNRNFEGRIHPDTRANYLASPLLVIAYAIAGRIDIDFEKEPLGHSSNGPVYLRDIWPNGCELQEVERKFVIPLLFEEVYSKITTGNERWNGLDAPSGKLYPWDESSTYIKKPPFFEGMTRQVPQLTKGIKNARVLLNLGDSVTTDHISPAGSIARNSPAAMYLTGKGLAPREFNSYGSRRGNDSVMERGTFANIRLVNKFIGKAAPKTVHLPSGETMPIFDVAQLYKSVGTPLIILAGKEYGCGSSRDWAAKGPYLLGIKAVIAESYERIHRSNLVGMGIIPLEFIEGQTADTLGLTGHETFTIDIDGIDAAPRKMVTVKTTEPSKEFKVVARFDTELELQYFRNGGILQYMVRKVVNLPKS